MRELRYGEQMQDYTCSTGISITISNNKLLTI